MLAILIASLITGTDLNPLVTQENIQSTICDRTWETRTHQRPNSYYTNKIKKQLAHGHSTKGLILDHIIAIEDGGSPTNPSNMQLQTKTDSYRKDKFENKEHSLICARIESLSDAQEELRTWK